LSVFLVRFSCAQRCTPHRTDGFCGQQSDFCGGTDAVDVYARRRKEFMRAPKIRGARAVERARELAHAARSRCRPARFT
jgi:hypothetical protein